MSDGDGFTFPPLPDTRLRETEAPERAIEPEVAGAAAQRARREETDRVDADRAARVSELEEKVASLSASLARAERRAEIERAATAAGAIDSETARLLIEHGAGERPEATVDELVGALRSRKPFLFQTRLTAADVARGKPGLMGAASVEHEDRLGDMARRARSSGDRREIERYLAARRGG